MGKWRDAAAYAQQLWEIAEPYLDDDRPSEASRAFHAVIWEMYLTATFLERGHALMRRSAKRMKKGGPDIQIGSVEAWVEAVIATRGAGPDAVPELDTDLGSPAREVPDREILLRITKAIDEKWKKYLGYRADERVRADEPFVIAINGGQLPTGRLESTPPRIARAMFGIGPLVVSFDRETLRQVGEYYAPMPAVTKVKGDPVDSIFFRDANYAGISAVMWGTTDVLNHDDYPGGDLFLVHNPYARNPLPRGWFQEGAEFWAEKNETELHWQIWRRGELMKPKAVTGRVSDADRGRQ